jgi:choline dehydrogenase-like flavoprotein
MSDTVDVVVIGMGPGGEAVAEQLAEAGLNVVGIDKHLVGLRARIVLAAWRRQSNAGIARDLGVGIDTVRTWQRRFRKECQACATNHAVDVPRCMTWMFTWRSWPPSPVNPRPTPNGHTGRWPTASTRAGS